MITPYLPYPPFSGGRMRTYNLLKFLRDDCDVTLICFGRPEEMAHDYTPLGDLCDYRVIERAESPGAARAAVMSLTSPRPVTMRLYGGDAMRSAIAECVNDRDFDVIHVESFYMMQNLPQDLKIPVLLSEPAIEYRVWAQHARIAAPSITRPGVALEALKMRIIEPRVWASADAVGAMSSLDAEIIQRRAPNANIMLTPNGVDVDYFTPDSSVERKPNTAIYMGDYKYFPNTDAVLYFIRDIMPRIKEARPDFHFIVLGKDPPAEIKALAGPDITVTGLVDDTRPYLQASAVFVCPLRSGSGTRFKLMEATACGCPVVSGSIGCEGLNAVDGQHMLIRDEPQDFADAVLSLLNDPDRGQALANEGREWVIENHAWAHSAALVKAAYDAIAS